MTKVVVFGAAGSSVGALAKDADVLVAAVSAPGREIYVQVAGTLVGATRLPQPEPRIMAMAVADEIERPQFLNTRFPRPLSASVWATAGETPARVGRPTLELRIRTRP
jgi:hypothetical protein